DVHAAKASTPSLTVSAATPRRSSCRTKTSRLTGWSSTTSTRRHDERIEGVDARLEGEERIIVLRGESAGAARNVSVTVKVEPTRGVLSTLACPPISSARRRTIERPRPVPPYCRVVALSA